METKQLITFVTLASECNYQKASSILNYAPSTLAKQIHVLEGELGIKLIERKGVRIELTGEGKRFLPHAEKLLSEYNQILKDFSITPEKSVSIRVAGGEPLVGYSFSDLLRDYFQQNPYIRGSVQMVCCNNIPQMIENDEIDIGFIHDMNILKPAHQEVVPLYREQICLVTTKDHPLYGKKSVDYAALDGMDFIYTYGECSFCAEFISRMKKRGVQLKSELFLGSYNSVLNSVRCDGRIAPIPCTALTRVLDQGFVPLDWIGEPLLAWVQLLYSSRRPLSRIASQLVERTQLLADKRLERFGRGDSLYFCQGLA